MKVNSKTDRFITGQIYFIVMFDDENLTVPIVQTLRFVKKGERRNGSKYYLFKQLGCDAKRRDFLVDEKDAEHLVVDHPGLIRELRDCFSGRLSTSPKKSI